jgi:NADH dehydrogenase
VSQRVVIVGGGFAGVRAAKYLGCKSECEVTLVDRRNYHLFQPLLYQVATAGLSPAEIASPIRTIFSGYPNVRVLLDNVNSVDLQQRILKTESGSLNYDFLVLACGAKHSYFNHPEWESFSPGLKTLEQATEIRRRILLAYEQAEKETDPAKQQALLTFIVVGGGPTGVEMAGAIAEISRFTLERDFRNIHPERAQILLVEAGPRVLASFSEKLSAQAERDLEHLGVQVRTRTRVTEVHEWGVKLGDQTVHAKTVIWAAGVQPSSLAKTLGSPLDQVGRVKIEQDLSLPGHPEVFVLGDMAHFPTADGHGLPGLAPVAMQEGTHAAQNILATIRGRPRTPFRYKDKGTMATIGRRKAVAQVGRLEVSGLLAWFMWLFIHIYYLIGFKNRLFVFLEWMWAYMTFKRGARLILDKEWRSNPKIGT